MIGPDGALTEVGAKVAECPVEVGIARMVSFLLVYRWIDW